MPALKLFLLPILTGLGLSAITTDQQSPLAEGLLKAMPATSIRYPGPGNSSTQTLFNYIRCHRQAKNIVVNWGMTSIAGVDHFVIYHSEVGDLFDPLEEIFPDGTLKYSHKHEQVYPGYHYYYIAAVMTSGALVNSTVDVVRIVGH
jgi:hypothetical protein